MPRIPRFTPWLTPWDQLEAIFVAREAILDDLIERVSKAGETSSRIQTLLVGPRGAGKTHLLAMLYYRLRDTIENGLRVQFARLPENPIAIVSYQRLLAAIISALRPGQPVALDETLEPTLDQLAADGTIVVLLENLDEVFAQIGLGGQRKLLNYLQTSNSLLLVATTSVLDKSIADQENPFHGFFSVIQLQPMRVEQAQQMLIKIASLRGDSDLADYLRDERNKGRLEIVSRLAGTQPRIWSIFADVMTPGGLGEIADLLYNSFDDLTSHYRDRLMSLTPQQRLVVSELALADHPLHVQELAMRALIDQRSAARAVGELRNGGWVEPAITPWAHLLDGRRTYYELAEPLARLAFHAKEDFGRQLELIVAFLAIWLDPPVVNGSGLAEDEESFFGVIDDALASVLTGDAEPIMTLPGQVRAQIERRCKDLEGADQGLAVVRRELHRAVMGCLGWTNQPKSMRWVDRGESLARLTGSAEDQSIWSQWLARSGCLDQAATVLSLIEDEPWPV